MPHPPLPSLVGDLTSRHGLKLRFLMVGGWNTVFGYGLFLILDTLFSHWFARRYAAYLSAMVISNIVAIINAYVLHKYVTFQSEARGKETVPEFLRFSTTYLFSFGLSIILLPLLVEILHLQPKVAAAVVTTICLLISYIGHSRFSFRVKKLCE